MMPIILFLSCLGLTLEQNQAFACNGYEDSQPLEKNLVGSLCGWYPPIVLLMLKVIE